MPRSTQHIEPMGLRDRSRDSGKIPAHSRLRRDQKTVWRPDAGQGALTFDPRFEWGGGGFVTNPAIWPG